MLVVLNANQYQKRQGVAFCCRLWRFVICKAEEIFTQWVDMLEGPEVTPAECHIRQSVSRKSHLPKSCQSLPITSFSK